MDNLNVNAFSTKCKYSHQSATFDLKDNTCARSSYKLIM